MGHVVLGTASPPSLEKTMGGLDHTQAWQRVPRTAAGGGSCVSGTHLGQDSQMTPISHINGNKSPKIDENPQKLMSTTCKWMYKLVTYEVSSPGSWWQYLASKGPAHPY